MPACCLNRTTHTAVTKGVREFCSSGLGRSLLFLSDSRKSSLTECRIVAKCFEKCRFPVNTGFSSASRFPFKAEARCKPGVGPSQHHPWTKTGLLIHSKSHNQMLRGTWVRTAGLPRVSCARFCLVPFGNLPPLSPPLFS